jgi:hypothetical protein
MAFRTGLLTGLAALAAVTLLGAEASGQPEQPVQPGGKDGVVRGFPDWVSGSRVRRLAQNPIIRPEMLPKDDGKNINGPSLIRVPAWVDRPLGKYYLYFAHHRGGYIRMAYADALEGPWKIHEPGTLKVRDLGFATNHIASPDVVADDERRELRMYFHAPFKGAGQMTFVAVSKDGLAFTSRPAPLGIFYFRVFRWDGWWYAMAKGGKLYRSRDGLSQFEEGPNPFPGGEKRDKWADSPGPRHVAVQVRDKSLLVCYTSIGDAPERVFRCTIDLTKDWKQWRTSPAEEILKPETPYEGADLPVKRSASGPVHGRENALRDPGLFVEDGRTYLLYSVAGESGIAIAEIR